MSKSKFKTGTKINDILNSKRPFIKCIKFKQINKSMASKLSKDAKIDVLSVNNEEYPVPIYGFYKIPQKVYYIVSEDPHPYLNEDSDTIFLKLKYLQTIFINDLDASLVIRMSLMFYECVSLKNIDISSYNLEKVEDIDGMFAGCTSLVYLNLGRFNVPSLNLKSSKNVFDNCSVKTIICSNPTINVLVKESDKASKIEIAESKQSEIYKKIERLVREGKTEEEIKTIMENRGFDTKEILPVIALVIPDSTVIKSTIQDIYSSIESMIKIRPEKKPYTVSELQSELYKKYPREIVNETLLIYLSNFYVEV